MAKIKLFFVKLYKKLPVLAYDILSIPLAWYLAFWLRYNMNPAPQALANINTFHAFLILMSIQIACFYYFKVYRGLWRFTSMNDVVRLIKAVVATVLLIVPTLYLVSYLKYLPRSVIPLYCLILLTFLCGGRLVKRAYHANRNIQEIPATVHRVFIVGAGNAGESLVRDLQKLNTYLAVGFIDDNQDKQGVEIHGVRVLGKCAELVDLVIKYKIDLILIAIPSARSVEMRRIVDYCSHCQIPFRTLPSIKALASGSVVIDHLREVNIEDLLGRDPVQLDWEKIASYVKNNRIVVTGGGGSIGAELCRQIMALDPDKLMIIDNSEFNLYSIEQELKGKYPDKYIQIVLVSITDAVAIDYCFSQFMPKVVFHAAAYKHVPMLEEQVRVAVQNNILGTQIVAEASAVIGVEKFILISTDKAVNPTNIMGATKRVAEIYCQNLNGRVETQFITVRFGNVLGSAGSVVPLFQKQLQAGGPLTVTHPEIQRYFMTIPEASQLILQAMLNGVGSEIFVLDMGEPIKIKYLAEQMIRLAGKEPNKEIEIKYTGLRPGEKLFEELFHETEQLTQTNHEKLLQAKFRKLDWQELTRSIRLMNAACNLNNVNELYVLIKSLVPEFNASEQSMIIIQSS